MIHKIHVFLSTAVLVLSAQTSFAQSFQWAKGFGGTERERSLDLTTDSSGNVYTVGTFELTADFDPGPGIYSLTSLGNTDIYISVLDKYGNFLWAHSFGGVYSDYVHAVAIDGSGNVYITGRFSDTVDFDPGPGIFQVISDVTGDLFILKLDASGNFLWVKNCQAGIDVYQGSVTTDYTGNVYIAGEYNGLSDFDPGPGVFYMTPVADNDIFVMKLSPLGDFVWAKSLGGYSWDRCKSIALDTACNVFTAGSFRYTADFDPGPGVYSLDADASDDVFISKLDSSGNFVWAKHWNTGYCWGMTLDSVGNIYTTGEFNDTADFDPGPAVFNLVGLYADPYVSKLDANGNFLWARALNGAGFQEGTSVCVGKNGKVYTTGRYQGIMDCDPGPNTYNLNALNSNDVFLSVLDSSGNFISALSIDGSHSGLGGGGVTLSVDMEKNLLLTGTYNNTVDFNPPFGAIITANGNLDVFIIKYSDINVGDSESPASNGITIYPNPGNEIFYIDFGAPVTGNLTVTNALGQCVMNEQLQDISRYELNLRSAAGIYFLNFYSNDRQTSFKIVQQ